jgi:hypothetical protein
MNITATVLFAEAHAFPMPTPYWLFPVSPFLRSPFFLVGDHCSLTTGSTTNHHPLITPSTHPPAFGTHPLPHDSPVPVFLTTDHCSPTTVFTPPPTPPAPTPCPSRDPTPHAVL